MDIPKPRCLDDMAEDEFLAFLEEGTEDIRQGRVIDFNIAFDELEKRYSANGQLSCRIVYSGL